MGELMQPPLRKFIKKFINEMEKTGYSPKSLSTMEEGLNFFLKYFSEISKETLSQFRQMLIGKYKPSTVNLRIWTINKFSEYLCSGVNTKVTDYGVVFPRIKGVPNNRKTGLEGIITLEEYIQLKSSLRRDERMMEYFLLRTLGGTGMRPSEVLKITPAHIYKGYADIYSKRNKMRRIYFTDSLRTDFIEYFNEINIKAKEEGKEAISNELPIFNMNLNKMRYIIRRWGTLYNVRKEVLYPYSFRHMFGKLLMQKTQDIAFIGDILGHDSIETTRIYTRLSKDEQREKINIVVDW